MAVVFSSITPRGFLSFPTDATPIELRDLNVLIGPNGSGKSNLVEALDVLRAAPGDLPYPIRQGGGVGDWLWRGHHNAKADRCSLEVVIRSGLVARAKNDPPAVRYRLDFGEQGNHFVVLDERLENAEPAPGAARPYFYFGYENAGPTLNLAKGPRVLRREDVNTTQSVLSQRKDPETYPELSRLSNVLGSIRIYRSWMFGPNSPIRRPCMASEPGDRLNEAMDNLPVRIMTMKEDDEARKWLLHVVRSLSDGFTEFDISLVAGVLQLVIVDGGRRFSAHRLSDGTMRMLALAAILIDPQPDSVLVIEEPELGLHPDMMPTVRDLLLHAAERAQVIVTTHSTVLADAFTQHPEAVCVVEREEGATTFRRLSTADLRPGGEEGLGWQWMSGVFGGTRW